METCGASPWKDRPGSGTRRIYASSSISWRKECRRSTWLPLPGFALTEPGSRPTCVVFADAMSAPKTRDKSLVTCSGALPAKCWPNVSQSW